MKFKIKLFNEISIFFCFNYPALTIAIRNGNVEMVKLLLSKEGVDPNVQSILNSYIL